MQKHKQGWVAHITGQTAQKSSKPCNSESEQKLLRSHVVFIWPKN